jgi:hypothetical protein
MPLLGHSPGQISDYGHLGYHIITFDESQDDFGLGGGLIDDTDMGRGKLWIDADITGAAVKVIDGGVYTSNDAPTVTINDVNGFGSGVTASATLTQIGSTGEYYVSAVTLAGTSGTGYFAPDLQFSGSNTKHSAKAYITEHGLPNPLCFYNAIVCTINTACIGGLKMVNKDGTIISTLVSNTSASTGNKLGSDDTSGVGTPLWLESGNSISGLFRGDQITLIAPDSGNTSHTAGSAFAQTVQDDYQVILYIAKRGKNGGRWAKHVRPDNWASDGL